MKNIDTIDLLGKQVNNLKILRTLEILEKNPASGKKYREYFYECQCSCGRLTKIGRRNLISKRAVSCGCQRSKEGKDNSGWKAPGSLVVIFGPG